MKITLVNPPHLQLKLNYSSISHPPMGLCYIASYMRKKGHKVKIIDAVSHAIDKKSIWPANKDIKIVGLDIGEIIDKISISSDIIGVTSTVTPTWPYVRELVKAIKKRFPRIPLVIGGEHATYMWELILSTSPADFCVLGEGEITFEALVNAIKNGDDNVEGIAYRDKDKPVSTKARPRIRDLDSIPIPAWDLIDIEKYIKKKIFMGASKGRTMPILTARGCPYRCRFCPAPNMWKRIWIPRAPEKVVDEIEQYIKRYNADDFHLMDLTAIVRKDWTVKFTNEILNRKLKISWQLPVGTRTNIIDKDVTRLLMESGCKNITFGAESGSKKVLDKMDKDIDTAQMEKAIKTTLKSKINVCLFFLIGFPGEDIDDIKKTFSLIRRMAFIGVHEIAIATFVPVPGSSMFDELKIKSSDEFCYKLFSALSLNKTYSWNEFLSARQILSFKIQGLLMFYVISYALRPWRFVKLLLNLITGKQESKVDRVVQEMIYKSK